MKRRALLLIALLVAAPAAAQEQGPQPDLVDRVVAVVGDSVILQSEVEEQIERRRAFGEPVPTDAQALEALKRQELQGLINQMLMLQAAERDSVALSPADVQVRVEAAVAEQESRFGGRAGFERALQQEGMTLEQYRQMVARGVRQAGVRQQYMAVLQRDRQPPPVTDAEIAEFFRQRQGELGRRPATIEFEQVVVSPEPSDSAMEAARAEAQRVRQQLMEGADFEVLARRHSDDPASREQGGDLGWFRRGRMVPEFERVAFGLRAGTISPIVESPFGLHIIRVDKIRGPERQARHILIRPEVTAADEAQTQERAAAVAAALRSGASLDSLIEAVHDPAEQSRVGPALQDSLPAPYNAQLRGATAGDIVGPFRIPASAETYAVVRVADVTEAGEYSLEDRAIRDQIRQFLQREKMLEEVLEELRRQTYIDVRY